DAKRGRDISTRFGRGSGRQDREREAYSLGNLSPHSDRFDPKSGWQSCVAGCVCLGRLEAAGSEEFKFWPFGEKGVDLAINDLVTHLVLALFHDNPPAQHANLLNRIRVRNRFDGIYRLNARELPHDHNLPL